MKQGTIFILSGPSGVGKKTVRELLDFDALNLVNSVSWTTRQPREEDIEGVTYHFVSQEEFEANKAKGGFVESAGYADHAYGTPKAPMEAWVQQGINVMLEIEVKGAQQVMDQYPQAVSIFLMPPSVESLKSRLTGRGSGESEREIAKRLARAEEEMQLQDKYQHVVINDDAKRAADEVARIVREASQK